MKVGDGGRNPGLVLRGLCTGYACGIARRCEVEPLWFNTPANRLIPGHFRGPNVPPNRKLEFPIFNDCARKLASRWISLRKIVNPLGGSANVRLPARK
jgi:hypothetical protein